MPMHARRWHQGGEAVEQLQRGEGLRATAAGAGFAGDVDQVLVTALLRRITMEKRSISRQKRKNTQARSVGLNSE